MGKWPAGLLMVGCWTFGALRVWGAPAVVEHLQGIVEERQAGNLAWEPVLRGEKLREGASIRTGDHAQADIVVARGHHFHLHADSELDLTKLQDNSTETKLEKGRVLSQVKHLREGERFALQTPTAVCAVRGTEFETSAGEHGTLIAVYKGIVGVTTSGLANEIAVHAGQMTSVHDGRIETPRSIPRDTRAAAESGLAHAARHEVGLDMTRNQVIAAAAMERRLSDYQEGKNLVDVTGQRVRLEEYIVRPQPNQFKLVVLDERGTSQLDYFFYLGTFNTALPTDLSVALKNLSGTVAAGAPAYYLKSYEMGQSNTQDSVHDSASGGHPVKISIDGSGNYTLTDPSDPANTRTIVGAQLQSDGTYKVYNPLSDSYAVVSAATLSAVNHFGVYIAENDSFRDLAPGDSLWETRFNSYEHDLNNIAKITYAKTSGLSNILTTTLDAGYVYAGGFVTTVVQTDPNNIDSTITNYYGDKTSEQYRTVLINDQGQIAPQSAFSGVATGATYNNELLRWNYEQQVTASEFQGRKIDLVVEPKIFIESGLIQ